MKAKIEFIKERYYKGKKYKPGDILIISMQDAKIYINAKAAKYYKKPPKTRKIEDLSYKDLQDLCKKNNLKAVGSKEELILSLKERIISI
jgi:hypothetical protein